MRPYRKPGKDFKLPFTIFVFEQIWIILNIRLSLLVIKEVKIKIFQIYRVYIALNGVNISATII